MSSSRSRFKQAPYTGPAWQTAALYLALALIAQVEFLHYFTFHDATFSPVLILVVWYAIVTDLRRAAIFGLCAGLAEDILAASTGGAWTISTTLTAILASLLSRGFFADSIPLVGTIVAFATVARNLIFWAVMQAEGYPSGLGMLHFHQALWQALLNVVLVAGGMAVLRLRNARRLR
ncbi:MAG: rod shape-determining protein MreD [Candidatus Eremiobacteraeota bacterium]|nr:rod shape-determining protein MreD [Candidatus Eremiobacteraeota bacterium]